MINSGVILEKGKKLIFANGTHLSAFIISLVDYIIELLYHRLHLFLRN